MPSSPHWSPKYAIASQISSANLFLILGLLILFSLLFGWLIYLWFKRQHEGQLKEIRTNLLLSRSRFLRQLDHELKNPLTAMRLELAYLAGELPKEEYQKVLADITTQIDRISRLVTDLRRLAQLEEQPIQRAPVVVEDVLKEVMEAVQDHPNFQDRRVRLILPPPPSTLSQVSGDRGLLWLACFNLLDNALKFTPAGAEVEVRAIEMGPWLVLEFADNGPGIPGTDLPNIFEELYRAANARGVPGSGLGLALVRTVVSLHQGTIDVRSKAGKGAVFTMRLPISK